MFTKSAGYFIKLLILIDGFQEVYKYVAMMVCTVEGFSHPLFLHRRTHLLGTLWDNFRLLRASVQAYLMTGIALLIRN
jgi:hypothetical protein